MKRCAEQYCLQAISDLEPVPRGPTAEPSAGWTPTARKRAVRRHPPFRRGATPPGLWVLRFGTGAGITWGSNAEGEWRETELKAAHLVALATGMLPAWKAVAQ